MILIFLALSSLVLWINGFYMLATNSSTNNIIRSFSAFAFAISFFLGAYFYNPDLPDAIYIVEISTVLILGCLLSVFFFFLDKSRPAFTKKLANIVRKISKVVGKILDGFEVIVEFTKKLFLLLAFLAILTIIIPLNILAIIGIVLVIALITLTVIRYLRKKSDHKNTSHTESVIPSDEESSKTI